MEPVDRVLGKLEEFQKSTHARLNLIEHKIDKLNEFRWRVVGGAFVITILLTSVIEVIRILKE